MKTKTKIKVTFQQLLDETNRTQYTNKSVKESIKPCEPQEIEFFTVGKYLTDTDLDAEFASRGLEAAHPYALALYSKEHPEFADNKWIGTHWKDAGGNWCFATFVGWRGERRVGVDRYDRRWDDGWWFAGVRKSSKLETQSSTSDTLNFEKAVEMVKAAGYQIAKII